MKKLIIAIVAAVSFVTANSANLYAQASGTLNHFYLHGFSQNSGAVYDLAQYINGVTHAWTSGPELYSYSSYPSIPGEAASADGKFKTDHPEGHYIGVGYSAGGLLVRHIEKSYGSYNAISQHYMEGLVTLGTPNAGADLAGRWEGWIAREILADAKINRGDQSFVAYGTYLHLVATLPLGVAVGEAARAAWPFMQDMTPGSSFLSTINNSSTRTITSSLPRGWCAVYGLVSKRRLPAYKCSDGNYAAAQADYQSKIDDARKKSHDWDNKANDYASGGWWHRLIHKLDCIWARTRAGDWHACADGWEDLNDAWEWTTGDRGESDGFISHASAVNEAPITRRVPNEHNHGDLPGTGGSGTETQHAVWDAMHFDLSIPQN
jgi:hypothetical protein